jgi:hypothetical protein
MLSWLALGFLLLQDGDAGLLKRAQAVAERAGDLDPFVRAEASAEAARLCEEQDEALSKSRNASAMIVRALAGRIEAAALLRMPERIARQAVCELITPAKDQIPDLLRLLEARDLGLKMAACRALGRVEDQALRQTISTSLGHGMRRAGSADLLFNLVNAAWRGGGNPHPFLVGDADPDRSAIAIAALCNLPTLVLTEAFAPSLSRILESEKIDRTLRSLLIRAVGRRSPSALGPLLSIRDRKFRSEIVDVLDRTLADPLATPALFEAWKDAKTKKLDDGKDPPQPLMSWIEGWLKRLCGEGVTPENFSKWVQANYRTQLDKQADAAIARGAAGLRKAFEKETSWKNSPGGVVGVGAFAAYALLKCDVPPADPIVERCLNTVLERDPEGIYSASLAAMALAAAVEKGAPRRERLERRAQRIAGILADSQLKSGGWSYAAKVYPDQTVDGWSYDLSNTQFAILGLRAAVNAGAKVPRSTWERALALLEKTQASDGGWSYHAADSAPYTRMTAAGAGSWILCRISLDEKLTPADAAAETPQIRDALQWLRLAMEAAQLSSPPDYYLLYSVERICMASGIEKLGTRDWYADGASLLVRSQSGQGLWAGGNGTIIDTCMALLFLRKAFIVRPVVATESAERRASPEETLAVFERRKESLSVEGVKEIRVDRDAKTSFIRIVVGSEADARRLREMLGREIEGVPLRFMVE